MTENKKNPPGVRRYRVDVMLPMPVSANRMWRHDSGGHRKSEEYVRWIREAGWELARQRPIFVPGPHALQARFGLPKGKRKADLDNLVKPLLDLLVRHQVIGDDNSVTDISLKFDKVVPEGKVAVSVWKTLDPEYRNTMAARAAVSEATGAPNPRALQGGSS